MAASDGRLNNSTGMGRAGVHVKKVEKDVRWGGWVGLRCREVHEAEPSARGDVWTRCGKVDQNLDLDLDLDLDLAGGGGRRQR